MGTYYNPFSLPSWKIIVNRLDQFRKIERLIIGLIDQYLRTFTYPMFLILGAVLLEVGAVLLEVGAVLPG
jgi:hypothetical protein